MNSKLKELAEQAGFCFWQDEQWKPEGATIDWSTNYDTELVEFAKLIVDQCADIAEPYGAAHAIKEQFRLEDWVDVPVDLDNETLLSLSLEAHRRDITLNQLIVEILEAEISRKENEDQQNITG